MPERKMYEVLYRARPAWDVGEGGPDHMPGTHYPGDCPGLVIAVRELGKGPSLRNMSDKDRLVVVLDLAPDEVSRLRSRELKIDRGRPAETTFDDRYGAIAPALRAGFVDAEIAEEKSLVNERRPKGERDPEGNQFSLLATSLAKVLPKTVTYTGTGLYSVKVTPEHNDDTQSGAPGGNLLLQSEALDTLLSWSRTAITVTANQVADPNGNVTADQIDYTDNAGSRIHQSLAVVVGQHTGSIWLRCAAGTEDLRLAFWDSVSGFQYEPITVTATWQRFTITRSFGDTTGWFNVVNAAAAGVKTVYAWGAQLTPGAVPGPYVKTTTVAKVVVITLTTGGLGEASAWAGGYVTNATRSETRAIISHTDTTITLEGDLSAWLDTDDLDIYDAWSTIQAALDQLWTDQGAATFTASQYIRIFAGTYDEEVTPNASLDPDETNGFLLFIEGDPDDDRDNIHIERSSGRCFYCYQNQTIIRHLKGTNVDDEWYRSHTASEWNEILDCEIHHYGNANGLRFRGGGRVADCEITLYVDWPAIWFGATYGGGARVERTIIHGGGIATGIGGEEGEAGITIEACVFDDLQEAVRFSTQPELRTQRVANCTFHACGVGLLVEAASAGVITVVNNIFKDCTYCYQVADSTWPEETTSRRGNNFVQRNNVYHGYTNFAYDGTNTRTYAQWIAFDQVDSAGELDDTDPLLTDAASDDLSLQDASPCRGAGVGSGVFYYVDGTTADEHYPNIGAEGTADDPPTPAWAGDDSDLNANARWYDGDVDLDWDAAAITGGPSSLAVEYTVQYRTVGGAWTEYGRTTLTDYVVSGLTAGTVYEFRILAHVRDYTGTEVTPTDTDTATPNPAGAPGLALVSATDTAVVVTPTRGDAPHVRVRLIARDGTEEDEETWSGSGNLTLTPTSLGRHYVVAWGVDGNNHPQSEPSACVECNCYAPAAWVAVALRNLLSAESTITGVLGTHVFHTATGGEPAIFTIDVIPASAPDTTDGPMIQISEIGGPDYGTKGYEGADVLARVRVVSNKGRNTSALRNLAWDVRNVINRANLNVANMEAFRCIADAPMMMSDERGFPQMVISVRVLLLEARA